MDCEVCLQPLPHQTGRGRRRLYHERCKAFADGLALLRFGVAQLPALTAEAAGQLAAEVVLVRNSIVRYVDTAARVEYGAKLRRRRLKVGVSQSGLADAAGLNQRQISRYELGQWDPAKDTREALDGALCVFSQSKKNPSKSAEVAA